MSAARLTKFLTWLYEGWGFPFRPGGGAGRGRRSAMQAYAGIDVHRRWSKIAVVDEGDRYGGEPERAQWSGGRPGAIGDRPAATLVAFEAGVRLELADRVAPGPWLRRTRGPPGSAR